MALEQGLSFTVIEAPHPFEGGSYDESYNAERDFYSAQRVWLGYVPGTDWLHDELERQLGEERTWYTVRSGRDAAHIGAAGETSTVILLLMGGLAAGLAERAGADIYDWVKSLAQERRKVRGLERADGPPDFKAFELAHLGEGIRGELADIMRVPVSELEIVSLEKREGLALLATYRLKATGGEYTAEVGTDFVHFRRIGAQPPKPT